MAVESLGSQVTGEGFALERPGHPRLGLPDRRRGPGGPARLVPGQQHRREPAAPEDRLGLPLSRARGGLRDRRHDDRLLAGQHLRARDPGRHAQHAEGGGAGHLPGHHPRHDDRRRPAVAQLAARQDLRRLCRDVPERAAAAVAVPDLQADQRGLPRPAPGDQRPELVLPQQPRPLLPGAARRSDPSMDGHRAAGRHRRGLRREALGQEAPGRDRPAFPDRLGQRRPGARPAASSSGCWAARRTT